MNLITDERGRTYESPSDALRSGRVVYEPLLSQNNKEVEIREACDANFYITLNKEQFGKWLQELKEVYDKMID